MLGSWGVSFINRSDNHVWNSRKTTLNALPFNFLFMLQINHSKCCKKLAQLWSWRLNKPTNGWPFKTLNFKVILTINLRKWGFCKKKLSIGTSQLNFYKFCQTPWAKQRNLHKWANKKMFMTFDMKVIKWERNPTIKFVEESK